MGPLVRWLVKHGVTANTVTVVGTVGAMAGALAFCSRGVFFVGTLIIWAFVMLDFVDGSMARARGGSDGFGAVLDSTIDRIADAAVFGALIWWFAGAGDSLPLLLAGLLCLVLGPVVSYVKARAEGARAALRRRARRAAAAADHRAGRHRPRRPRRAVRAGDRAVGAGRAVGVHGLAAAGRGAPAVPGGAAGVSVRERAVDAGFAAGWAAVRALPQPVASAGVRGGRPSWPRAGTPAACAGCGRTWPGSARARHRPGRAGPRGPCGRTRGTGWRRSGCRRSPR